MNYDPHLPRRKLSRKKAYHERPYRGSDRTLMLERLKGVPQMDVAESRV